jgi:hypothetical protein
MSTTTCPECGDLFEKDAAIESDMRGNSINTREQEPVHYRWLLHFADREPLEVAFSPPANHADVLDTFPEAAAAEPWPEQAKGTPGTSGHAGNAKPGLPLGYKRFL